LSEPGAKTTGREYCPTHIKRWAYPSNAGFTNICYQLKAACASPVQQQGQKSSRSIIKMMPKSYLFYTGLTPKTAQGATAHFWGHKTGKFIHIVYKTSSKIKNKK
jgi:hypothetical protein